MKISHWDYRNLCALSEMSSKIDSASLMLTFCVQILGLVVCENLNTDFLSVNSIIVEDKHVFCSFDFGLLNSMLLSNEIQTYTKSMMHSSVTVGSAATSESVLQFILSGYLWHVSCVNMQIKSLPIYIWYWTE